MIEPVFLATIIPLLFLLILVRGESRLIIAFFAAGLLIIVPVYYLNTWLASRMIVSLSEYPFLLAPPVEEICKALPLVFCFLLRRKRAKHFILFLAMAAGIGFSIHENFLYLSGYEGLGYGDSIVFIVLRSLSASLMHGVATLLIGLAVMYIIESRTANVFLLAGAYVLAVVVHAFYNLCVSRPDYSWIGLLIPLLLFFFILLVMRMTESRKVKFEEKEEERLYYL